MSKLISYFRVNRSIELFVFPVLLLAGTLMTISLSDKVEMRNMAGFMFLLPHAYTSVQSPRCSHWSSRKDVGS